MSVAGKKHDEWVALTVTDFGEPGRREIIRHHFSVEAAVRAWDSILKVYSAPWATRAGSRVWQEDRLGEVFNRSWTS